MKECSAPFTISFSILLSVASSILLATSQVCRNFNIGDQKLAERLLVPISISFFGLFTITATLNVSLLWIELCIGSSSKFQNLKKTKYFVYCCGFLYLVCSLVLFFSTKSYTPTVFLSVVMAALICIAFRRGAYLLSKKLEIRNLPKIPGFLSEQLEISTSKTSKESKSRRTSFVFQRSSIVLQAPLTGKHSTNPKATKAMQCARYISWYAAFFSSGSIGYAVFSSVPNLGILAFICSVIVVINPLLIHLKILNFLRNGKRRTRRKLHLRVIVRPRRQIVP